MIFTDPRSGEQHGYYDRWATDDSFHYTGRGQRGDQTLTSGNLAVANHAKDGRALRVFRGAKGIVQYIGEFVLDDQDPYDWGTAHSPGGGPQRRVIRFHLRRVDRPPHAPRPVRWGAVPIARRDHEAGQPTTRAPQDPDAGGRGWRAHHRLQDQLAELVRAAGWSPRDPAPIDPEFDLAWETPQGIVVVEVKSCTKANEVRRLRMGIGQVLDYDDSLRARGRAVLPVLYLEREPSDARWVTLAKRYHVRLIWPGTEDMSFPGALASSGDC